MKQDKRRSLAHPVVSDAEAPDLDPIHDFWADLRLDSRIQSP